MIKSLRRKFIAIVMASIILVLGVIIAVINIANFSSVNQRAEQKITLLAENGGMFPKSHREALEKKKHNKEMTPETPFETRYFTVTFTDDDVSAINTGKIAAVSTEVAMDYAERLYAKNSTDGFIDSYKYKCIDTEDGVMYIFLDCTRDLSTFKSFLVVSILVSLVGIVFVFLLVVFFSGAVVRPFAQSYEKQKRFITDASHEIKTPLTIIDASTEIIEMEKGESEWTSSIKNQIKRLTALTEKLVFLSRMDEENTRLEMAQFSLSDAVYESAQPFEAVASSKNKALDIDIEEGISLYGDEGSLRRVISLLLDNAMKYSDENGSISLRLKRLGKHSIITVYNSVESIEKGKHEELFERFYRTDASRNSATGGHGIGLSVVKAVVNAHKGKITAKSEDGKSLIFTIVL